MNEVRYIETHPAIKACNIIMNICIGVIIVALIGFLVIDEIEIDALESKIKTLELQLSSKLVKNYEQ